MNQMTLPKVGPIELEIIRHRLEAINADSIDTLLRVSGSQIASEANDLNTSLMTADGTVVSAGKFTMVLSTSLNLVVADILKNYSENPGIRPGDQFITNDPYVGTNHQPDVVVVAPIFDANDPGRLIAWTGSVCHEADIGGPVPGGFNYEARSIYDEGVPLAPMKIVEGGVMRRDIEREYVFRSRTPEHNALDLLGQVAANRSTTERINELCRRYGTDVLVGAMHQLVDSTEAAFRARLRELPDGVWRANSYVEHYGKVDGKVLPNQVHAVRLRMVKRGDDLELDFTESSDQAPGPINSSLASLSNFAMAAVLGYLCQGLAWVPGAVFRAVRIKTRPGSLLDPKWPAPVAMAVTYSSQGVRITVNGCIAAMLDASELHHHRAMASTQFPGSGAGVSGLDEQGRVFATLFMDELAGGGGARVSADGENSSGTLSSPGAQTANIETTEAYFPVLYRARRELADSGGPGRHRGGVGTLVAYGPHRAQSPFSLAPIAAGLQHPCAIGISGGDPGAQGASLVAPEGAVTQAPNWTDIAARAEVKTPFVGQQVDSQHVFVFSSQGGGGCGDALDRDPADVLEDVLEGLVSAEGARRDYGVIVKPAKPEAVVDDAATLALRASMRRERIDGREPRERGGYRRSGRRLSGSLDAVAGKVMCACCGIQLCAEGENLFAHLQLREATCGERFATGDSYEGSERFCVRHFYCPGCATQIDVHISLRGEPLLEAISTKPVSS